MPITAHATIMKLASDLGYFKKVPTLKEGLCVGISTSWMKACLINQEAKFNHMIQRIIDENNSLVEQINAVKAKVMKKDTLNDNDNELFECDESREITYKNNKMLFVYMELENILDIFKLKNIFII